MRPKKELKAKQIKAMQLLAMGEPKNVIAGKLEITTMTLYRWQKLPEFNSKLNFVANSGLKEISRKMNATTITAIETLQEAMCNISIPLVTRMKAAQIVLNNTSSVNGMLEKALKHRTADFDLKQRWDSGPRFDSNGDPMQKVKSDKELMDEDIITI